MIRLVMRVFLALVPLAFTAQVAPQTPAEAFAIDETFVTSLAAPNVNRPTLRSRSFVRSSPLPPNRFMPGSFKLNRAAREQEMRGAEIARLDPEVCCVLEMKVIRKI